MTETQLELVSDDYNEWLTVPLPHWSRLTQDSDSITADKNDYGLQEKFGVGTVTITAPVTRITATVSSRYDVWGGTGEDDYQLRIYIYIGGVLYLKNIDMPSDNTYRTYTHTITGGWNQSELDAMQLLLWCALTIKKRDIEVRRFYVNVRHSETGVLLLGGNFRGGTY